VRASTNWKPPCREIHPGLLDRDRPLWKFHVFEGLAPSPNGNKRVGLYSKLHHAAVDGQAAVALANAILDVTPRAARRGSQTLGPQEGVSPGHDRDAARRAGQPGAEGGQHRAQPAATVGTLKDAASTVVSHSSLLGGEKTPSNLTLAPRTALNASVTNTRAFATVSVPLAELKDIGRAFDATINDMVLMLCSSACAATSARSRALPRKSLIAAVPITLRDKGDASPDNQASA
jgi:diacylglycerol O-acyltransferase